jgi:hypothetical protein
MATAQPSHATATGAQRRATRPAATAHRRSMIILGPSEAYLLTA